MNLLEVAERRPFDVIVIGGGINGCGVARELAVRGLDVALLEAEDFGFGTTWRSTRLIHGGLRYLEHGEVGLVRESLRERGRLLRERPHLVKPQPFLLPQLPWSRRPAWQIGAGLTAYDLLAAGGGLPRHRRIGRDELLESAPGLGDLAKHGFAFHDARAVAPERLALELALEAREAGATIANHAKVVRIESRDGAVMGVEVEWEGKALALAAPHVVNAAGPWVDSVNAAAGIEGPRLIGGTRGSHLAFELPETVTRDAVLSTARSDGRVLFAVPHSGLLLVGTTDVRHDCDPWAARPDAGELRYLLEEARALFPAVALAPELVRYAYTGVRPLLASTKSDAEAISRRHAVIDHGTRGGPAGLYSVAGGKLSTYRPLAMEVLRRIGRSPEVVRAIASGSSGPALPGHLPPAITDHLERYGAAAAAIARRGAEIVCEHAGAVVGEVEHAVKNEGATSVADVLMRRTGIAWHTCRGLCCHASVAGLMAEMLGWDSLETERHVATYEREVARHLPAWDEIVAESG